MDSKRVIVVGGSLTGMAAGLALAESGCRVTILEREKLPSCDDSVSAFQQWQRPGAPQTRHSHAFLARLHNDLENRAPALYAELLAAGAERMHFKDMVKAVYEAPRFIPEDDELTLLACRRITFDWVFRRHLEARSDIAYRDGTAVEGLESRPDGKGGRPRVTGVRVAGERGRSLLPADLVVDASGRNTKLASWLSEIGAAPLEEESESCGIFYSSRFYRLREGVEPPPIEGPIGADLGYMKYAIFPGDSRIFSVTFAASSDDSDMRSLLQADAFNQAALALPATRAWVDSAVSDPITKVYGYADLYNRRRFFVRDQNPLALGLFPIGDALVHQNPLSGRGCTLGWVAAFHLADALSNQPGDLRAFAAELDARIERDVIPWYENMRDQDRAQSATAVVQAKGEDPFGFQRADGTIDPPAYLRSLIRDGLMPALREDLDVLRAFMRVFNLLDQPRDLLADPKLLGGIMRVWQQRETRERVSLGPERVEMVARLRSAA